MTTINNTAASIFYGLVFLFMATNHPVTTDSVFAFQAMDVFTACALAASVYFWKNRNNKTSEEALS